MAEWSTKKALAFLIGSTCVTLTLSLWIYARWTESKRSRIADPQHRILAIVQTGPEKEALKTAYLAELLGLSIDRPTPLYAFDLKKAQEKLLDSPLIAEAQIKRVPPSSLYIDYEVRHAIAWLSDYQNIAIDQNGFLFPVAPFFSPKELPEIYLGLPPFGAPEDRFGRKGGCWQTPLQNCYLRLAFDILQFLEIRSRQDGIRIKRIDVSNAFAPILGQREVVLFTEEEMLFPSGATGIFPKILRLMPKDYPQQLTHFFSLRRTMAEDYKKQVALPTSGRFAPRIIDLRIPQLAFVQND